MSKVLASTFEERLHSLLHSEANNGSEEYFENLRCLLKDIFTCLDIETIDSYLSNIDIPNFNGEKFCPVSFISYVICEHINHMHLLDLHFLADLVVKYKVFQEPSDRYVEDTFENGYHLKKRYNFLDYYISLCRHHDLDNLIYFVDTASTVVPITAGMISNISRSNNCQLVFHVLENYPSDFTKKEWEDIVDCYSLYIDEWFLKNIEYYNGVGREECLEMYFKYLKFILEKSSSKGVELEFLQKKITYACDLSLLTLLLDFGFDPYMKIDSERYIDRILINMKNDIKDPLYSFNSYDLLEVVMFLVKRGILEKEEVEKYIKVV